MEKAPVAYREVWDRKPILQAIYGDIYQHMLAAIVPGPTLEVGGGSGNFKLFRPDTVSSDIMPAPWLDLVCDAQRMPFADASFANIVMVDVLHHIESPLRFLKEAAREAGGEHLAMRCPAIGVAWRHIAGGKVSMPDVPCVTMPRGAGWPDGCADASAQLHARDVHGPRHQLRAG